MVQAYNFLASWQLFPEKSFFETGISPKSGNYKIESIDNGKQLSVSINWVSIENEAFYTSYDVTPDGTLRPFENQEMADSIVATINNTGMMTFEFIKNDTNVLTVIHEILPNGYLKVTQRIVKDAQNSFTNTEVYHKQMSVLPYASSVGSVAVRPTKEGVIKHKALSAMEEQTNMQLDQIRQQIELLARQAQEIKKRKELSLMIYEAKLNFKPQIGQTYFLYEKRDGSHLLSLVSPGDWGANGPFKQFVAAVKLLADHTWSEVAG